MNKDIKRRVYFGSLLGALGCVLVLTFVGAGGASALPCLDCGSGGGGGGGGGTAPPRYRLRGEVYQIGGEVGSSGMATADVRGWSRFETQSGDKVKADHLSVTCGGGGAQDHDDEDNAGFTNVEFTIGPAAIGLYTVRCFHQATFGGVTYTKTSTAQIFL